ncbi:hypothetical protein HMI54_007894 [Coelomomyces lativittatus]|nr:hypothetical protein HMI56_003106 [Coelomomyces lativittatus]KAJ1503635.1 hypothetical protein HMI54_007894 [Coelomomyces lativittatus]KAJ1510533.1 hypothetical protein HMI55_006958 [Coelomomyces lativittatus]
MSTTTHLTPAYVSELTQLSLQEIRQLNVSNTHLTCVDDLSMCLQLSKLDLSQNQLTNSGLEGLIHCPSISVLNLSHNQLHTLAPLDQFKSSLNVVNVSGNPMYHLSSHLLALTNLKAFIAKHTHIAKIENIGQCVELNTLILADNKITSIPPLKSLTQLKKLSLTNNPIRVLPDLSHHLHLKELRLNGCLLETLPDTMRALAALEVLDVGNNRIQTLKCLEPLKYLNHLSQLNVKGNPLCTHHPPTYVHQVRQWLPRLSTLDNQPFQKLKTSSSLGSKKPTPSSRPSVLKKRKHDEIHEHDQGNRDTVKKGEKNGNKQPFLKK